MVTAGRKRGGGWVEAGKGGGVGTCNGVNNKNFKRINEKTWKQRMFQKQGIRINHERFIR